MTTFDHIQGTTYAGMDVQIDVNSVALDLTDATIEAAFVNDCKIKRFTIANGGITDVVALAGSFWILKDTLLDWTLGKWVLTVTITLQDGTVKKYIHESYQINII